MNAFNSVFPTPTEGDAARFDKLPAAPMSDPDEGWAWLRERAAARPSPGGAPRRPPPPAPAPGGPPGAPPPPLPGPSPAARASAKAPSAAVYDTPRYHSNGATSPASASSAVSASAAGVAGGDGEIVALAQSIARAAGMMEHSVRAHVVQRQEAESRASASARRGEVVRMGGVDLPGKVVGRIGAELVGRGGLPALGRLQVRPLPPALPRQSF